MVVTAEFSIVEYLLGLKNVMEELFETSFGENELEIYF